MSNTHHLLDELTAPSTEATEKISEVVDDELDGYTPEEWTFFFILWAVKNYKRIDDPDHTTTDYLLAAEEISNRLE